MDFLAAMESVGVDSQTVLRRFSGMEMLWKKFVFRYLFLFGTGRPQARG